MRYLRASEDTPQVPVGCRDGCTENVCVGESLGIFDGSDDGTSVLNNEGAVDGRKDIA
jgi:hypothetical protein